MAPENAKSGSTEYAAGLTHGAGITPRSLFLSSFFTISLLD